MTERHKVKKKDQNLEKKIQTKQAWQNKCKKSHNLIRSSRVTKTETIIIANTHLQLISDGNGKISTAKTNMTKLAL